MDEKRMWLFNSPSKAWRLFSTALPAGPFGLSKSGLFDVAGEHTAATQPFPTLPPSFTPQGVTLDDAFDATPELKAAAQAEMKKYRLGPIFTPPSYKGTIMRPGIIGGANWGGGAFDLETGILYIKTTNLPHLARIVKPDS